MHSIIETSRACATNITLTSQRVGVQVIAVQDIPL